MENFKHTDEELPRTAPKPKQIRFKGPISPVVPEISMIMSTPKTSEFFKQWPNLPGLNSPIENPPPIKSYTNVRKSRLMKSVTEHEFEISAAGPKATTPNLPIFTFPPPPTPTEFERKVSENIAKIAQQIELHEKQIVELKEFTEKVSREIIELTLFEVDQHEKTRKMLIKPQIVSVGIQCKLGQDDKNEQKDLNKTDKSFEPKLKMKQKKTGTIPKNKTVKQTCDEANPNMNLQQLKNDLEKYEALSGLPREKLDEAMQIMALTSKYVSLETLKDWGYQVPGKTNVSMATLEYMQKYRLIETIPEAEKNKMATESSQESANKILDTEAIKNQPKFM